eukprot:COSAG01_NODE_71328_length_256_cov_0.662420_1_plen_44_part_01
MYGAFVCMVPFASWTLDIPGLRRHRTAMLGGNSIFEGKEGCTTF